MERINSNPGMNSAIKSPFPAQTPVGMAYVPFQQWEPTYTENEALEKGTIFPSLFLPFEGRQEVNK